MRPAVRARRSPRWQRPGAGLCAAIALAAALAGSAASSPLQTSAAPCGFTTKGAPWTYKGQRGTIYTVVVLAGASCATAHNWIARLTHERAAFDLKPVPAGWYCNTTGITTGLTKTGQCTTTKGGIVEWLPKLKK